LPSRRISISITTAIFTALPRSRWGSAVDPGVLCIGDGRSVPCTRTSLSSAPSRGSEPWKRVSIAPLGGRPVRMGDLGGPVASEVAGPRDPGACAKDSSSLYDRPLQQSSSAAIFSNLGNLYAQVPGASLSEYPWRRPSGLCRQLPPELFSFRGPTASLTRTALHAAPTSRG
jgi:hypothetical protein